MPVLFGVDAWITRPADALKKLKLGLVTSNVATCAFNGETARVALRRAGFNIVRLFSPEHGLGATAADGAQVDDHADPATNLPVKSLYGETNRPQLEWLEDLDAVAFDIPDVGARFYTYIWTLSHVMEACAEARKPLYLLDRPNPIGGRLEDAEGPTLDEVNLSSFVGRWNIPVRYSLTTGELAQLWNAERNIGCDLHIVKVTGWKRTDHWPATGLKFVQLSPAMPSYETALIYPGTCLIEGTNLSEGRGTTAPFQLIGAPWIDARRVSETFNAIQLPGIVSDPVEFTPEGRKYAGEICHGIKLRITDPITLRPVAAGLRLLATIIRLHPEQFEWLPYPTAAAGKGLQHFDRLIGRLDIREALEHQRDDLPEKIQQWTQTENWAARVKDHLLYS
ncbi:MAG TPA: DUF1343 domain-containing protein [Tepidisphaeraceae bacterium]